MDMPNYKELYLTLFRATEEAVNILIAAQQKCEELYADTPDPCPLSLAGDEDEETE